MNAQKHASLLMSEVGIGKQFEKINITEINYEHIRKAKKLLKFFQN